MTKSVVHEPENQRFCIQLSEESDCVAELLYEKTEANTYDLYHTEVPKEYRGKGLAGVLARAAFDHAVKEKSRILPTCTYLRKYYATNLTESEQRHVES